MVDVIVKTLNKLLNKISETDHISYPQENIYKPLFINTKDIKVNTSVINSIIKITKI